MARYNKYQDPGPYKGKSIKLEHLDAKPASDIPGTRLVEKGDWSTTIKTSWCKYSRRTLFHDKCIHYKTSWCKKCRHRYSNQIEELSRKEGKSYYSRISGL